MISQLSSKFLTQECVASLNSACSLSTFFGRRRIPVVIGLANVAIHLRVLVRNGLELLRLFCQRGCSKLVPTYPCPSQYQWGTYRIRVVMLPRPVLLYNSPYDSSEAPVPILPRPLRLALLSSFGHRLLRHEWTRLRQLGVAWVCAHFQFFNR